MQDAVIIDCLRPRLEIRARHSQDTRPDDMAAAVFSGITQETSRRAGSESTM